MPFPLANWHSLNIGFTSGRMFLHFSLRRFACPALITLRKHEDKNRLHESTFSNCQQKQIAHCISLQSKFSSRFFRFTEDSDLNTQTSRGRKSLGPNGSQVYDNLIGGNSCVTLARVKGANCQLLFACTLFALDSFVVWVLLFAVAIFYAFIVN